MEFIKYLLERMWSGMILLSQGKQHQLIKQFSIYL